MMVITSLVVLEFENFDFSSPVIYNLAPKSNSSSTLVKMCNMNNKIINMNNKILFLITQMWHLNLLPNIITLNNVVFDNSSEN